MLMTAISIKQPWTWMIWKGLKTIETRLWPTDFRGSILLVSSKGKMTRQQMSEFDSVYPDMLDEIKYGQALAIAELIDCRPMVAADEKAARCEVYDGAFSWVLEKVRQVGPIDIKGQLKLYTRHVPDDLDYEFQERLAIYGNDYVHGI